MVRSVCSFVFLNTAVRSRDVVKMERKVEILRGNANSSGRFAVDWIALLHKFQAIRPCGAVRNQDQSTSARAAHL
jgi:hypothetical protein